MSEISEKSFAARLVRTMADMDREAERLRHIDNRGKCCEGCSDRCFSVSETEFALILDYIKNNFCRDETLRVIRESKAQRVRLRSSCPALSETLEGEATLDELLRLGEARLPFSCVFQNEADSSCSVFEVRPLACRAYGLTAGFSDEGTYFTGLLEKMIGFMFLKNREGGCVIIRRPAPLFYFFSLVFKEWDIEELPEIEFCNDLLSLDEEEYIKKLVEAYGGPP